MPAVKFKPWVKCGFCTSSVPDKGRAARCRNIMHTCFPQIHSNPPSLPELS